jgi:protoheme IX farnesyltransferase
MINYYLLIKPGIIIGNLIAVAAGVALASHGPINVFLLLATLLGLGCVIASACVCNNYIDRHIDGKMNRTKNRPFARGTISIKKAFIFAIVLWFLGNLVLGTSTNLLTVSIANLGFCVYVFLYSLWKSRTIYGTAIGSIAGGIPPLVGYCAVSNQLDVGAWIFFAIMVLWQMPHFFAIAIYRLEDYKSAALPLLPIKRGLLRTKIHMLIYIVAFLFATAGLTLSGYMGKIYLICALILALAWLVLCIQGFKSKNDQLWGKQMFRFSLIVIMGLFSTIFFF